MMVETYSAQERVIRHHQGSGQTPRPGRAAGGTPETEQDDRALGSSRVRRRCWWRPERERDKQRGRGFRGGPQNAWLPPECAPNKRQGRNLCGGPCRLVDRMPACRRALPENGAAIQ